MLPRAVARRLTLLSVLTVALLVPLAAIAPSALADFITVYPSNAQCPECGYVYDTNVPYGNLQGFAGFKTCGQDLMPGTYYQYNNSFTGQTPGNTCPVVYPSNSQCPGCTFVYDTTRPYGYHQGFSGAKWCGNNYSNGTYYQYNNTFIAYIPGNFC